MPRGALSMQITNSLSRKKETFTPLIPNQVKMYVCGPTVYNFIHIGNARPLVFFDVVRRYFEFKGYQVNHTMNFTDVDDKIIDKARAEKTTSQVISEKYTKEYQTDMALLKVLQPHQMPKVTEYIPAIIKMIEAIIANGYGYVINTGEVLYSVRKFKGYGKLSGKNIDDLISGARVEIDEQKKDPLDFSLWKPQKKEDEPAWDSPWGKGRPGWHIECSAMSSEIFGETFDLHGGGMDLIHPHHENEIAQSEAASGKPFVRYWMHNNMLNLNAEKMSKSLGNIILTREFIERYSAECLKFTLLGGHYRSVIDFSEKSIRDSQMGLHRIYSTLEKCGKMKSAPLANNAPALNEVKEANQFAKNFQATWESYFEDDFNTARAIALVFDYVRLINSITDKKGLKVSLEVIETLNRFTNDMKQISQVLNLFSENPTDYLNSLRELILKDKQIDKKTILDKIEERTQARKNKDFKRADEIRNELLQKGIELKDAVDKTDWDVIFSN
jgi:cysteinyl-tRNA synthetase